jgi:hypothetical protein
MNTSRKRWVAAAILTVVLVPIVIASEPHAEGWWSHVKFLADDSLEGRNTGSEGHRKAAEYVATAFKNVGLTPAGSDGYFQPVALNTREIDEAHSSLTLVRKTGPEKLTLGVDANIALRVDPAPAVDADLVFAGYGLAIPEAHHDDFKGLEVRGKVVVYLSGAPPSISPPLAAHMQSPRERSALLNRLGAIGFASIANPKHMDIPWERATLARFLPSMTLADPSLDDSRGQRIAISVNPAHADKWFLGSGHTFQEILAAADGNQPLPHFALPTALKARVAVKRSNVESQNIVAVLPGNDPHLKDQYVVCTAHLDHLGIGKPINGDAIYNGAMDNAAGVASMIEIADALKRSGTKLRRSVLFVVVTGEEKGLLGSKFFANFPTVNGDQIVADINVDMFLPIFPLKSLTIYGLNESDLGADAADVARSLGVRPDSDPEPTRNLFIRSDQYSFIRRGIPSLALKIGFDRGSPEEQLAKNWLKERYHAPSDDVNQPVDTKAAEAFDTLVARLIERVANRDGRPQWLSTSFFRRFAKTIADSNSRGR